MNVVEKEFDAKAAEYESNRLASWYQAHADEMLEFCLDIEAGDILDIGCGTGHFLREYLKDKPKLRAVGIDVSSSMIDEASKNKWNNSITGNQWQVNDSDFEGCYDDNPPFGFCDDPY